jgi:hypothetical protein
LVETIELRCREYRSGQQKTIWPNIPITIDDTDFVELRRGRFAMEEQSWPEPVWDTRSYRKHLKANRRQWERSVTRAWTAEKGEPSQYDPNLSLEEIRDMEIGCVTGRGISIRARLNKRTYYRKMGRTIGASAGEYTEYIYVEYCNSGSVHGYPITWDELVSKKGVAQ